MSNTTSTGVATSYATVSYRDTLGKLHHLGGRSTTKSGQLLAFHIKQYLAHRNINFTTVVVTMNGKDFFNSANKKKA